MRGNLHPKCCLGIRIALFVLTSSSWGQCSARVLGYVLDFVYFFFLQLSSSQHLRYLSEPLVDLFDTMCSEDPSARPTASEALDCVRQLVVPREILTSPVRQPPRVPIDLNEEKKRLGISEEVTEWS